MKISYRWLGRHVDLSGITPQRVASDLTLSTAEVESLEPFLPHLSKIVVGHVLERAKHPDADKLSVCRVDVGTSEPQTIVCGAPNVAAGQKVAVALPGTELPGDLKIKKSKIRGVESAGMICSERELGLGDEHHGIWVLPESARVGKPVAEELALDDWIIEIDNKSLTHRPDLWGHRGIANEIAAMHARPLRPIDLALPSTGTLLRFPVRIDEEIAKSGGCTRYVALPIDGVGLQRSPDWLRALLFAVGQRPIDLLVDLSNFVMLDLGQPNHVFDRARLSPEGIVVRAARSGETMKTLDGVERKLATADMLICSGTEPVALAGVMGGEGSKVEAGTRSLLLEVAAFHPAIVRRTAQRLALRTDSSARFEKSLDPTLPLKAAAHFARLLVELVPAASFPSPITDVGAWKDPEHTIELRGERVRRLLGAEISDIEIADILARLGFGVKRGADTLFVTVPSARATKDVTIEQDLVEEVGRIHRYGNIAERVLVAAITPPPRDAGWDRRMLARTLQDRLSGAARFHETLSYSFVADDLLAKIGDAAEPHVAVINPVAEGFARIRRSVVPSLLASLEPNRRRGEVRLFEIGKGYLPEHPNERGEPREVHECGLVLCALPAAKNARFDADALSRLRGVVLDLLRAVGIHDAVERALAAERAPRWANQGCGVEVASGDRAVACVARLDPALRRALGLANELDSDVAVANVSLDALLALTRTKPPYHPIPRFPSVKVDVAVAMVDDAPAGAVAAAIEKAGKGLVHAVELFDLYRGPNVGAGKKSLAWHVELAADRTLTDEDVAKFLARVERELEQVGAELRRT